MFRLFNLINYFLRKSRKKIITQEDLEAEKQWLENCRIRFRDRLRKQLNDETLEITVYEVSELSECYGAGITTLSGKSFDNVKVKWFVNDSSPIILKNIA